MADTYIVGRNRSYGKRKRSSGVRSESASALSCKLFYGKGAPAPILSARAVDKIVNRSLKTRNITDPEQKFFDAGLLGSSISTTNVLALLTPIVQGDTVSTRTGNKIRISKIEVMGYAVLSTQAVGGSDNGKISIFIHKQANGVGPTFAVASTSSTISAYNGLGAGGQYPFMKSAIYADQFYIIKDWDYCLDATAGVFAVPPTWQADTFTFKAEVPINRVIEYNQSNGGTVADCVKNAIYIGYTGSQAPGATATTMNWYTRVWYTDV